MYFKTISEGANNVVNKNTINLPWREILVIDCYFDDDRIIIYREVTFAGVGRVDYLIDTPLYVYIIEQKRYKEDPTHGIGQLLGYYGGIGKTVNGKSVTPILYVDYITKRLEDALRILSPMEGIFRVYDQKGARLF